MIELASACFAVSGAEFTRRRRCVIVPHRPYPDKQPGQANPEIPIKENDHAVDELRYVLQTHNKIIQGAPIYVPVMDSN
jgi:hypothetical protein